jgi:hypothetical protein
MADSTAVAIVGVSAGALVALVSPIINGRQITAGQKRRFEHDEWLADRRELRVLLDDTLAGIANVERALGELVAIYGEQGPEREAYVSALHDSHEAIRSLERTNARLTIRIGIEGQLPVELDRALGHARHVISAINRFLVVPMVSEPPGMASLRSELHGIETASRQFAKAAKDLVGAKVEP